MHRHVGMLVTLASSFACPRGGSSESAESANTVSTLGETGGETDEGNVGDRDGGSGPGETGTSGRLAFDIAHIRLDLPNTPEACKVSETGDTAAPCQETAPADSFAPVLQWSFTPDDANHQTLTTPLVANLTDDNHDGAIDLCDTPDVVLLAFSVAPSPGNLYVLDGATGKLHFEIPNPVNWRSTPAVGDIDGDGIAEILAESGHETIYCFEHDGTLEWESPPLGKAPNAASGPAIALADIDADGDVELIFENLVIDHTGAILWASAVKNQWSPATVVADLDGDDFMELIHPTAAYRHDGTLYYDTASLGPGFTAVANMDGDDDPEIIVASSVGISLVEHDGTIVLSGLQPVGEFDYARPPAVHDIDGDDVAELAVGSGTVFAIYDRNIDVLWKAAIDDASGSAGSTAFDFLGDSRAEAMYADENFIWAFAQAGVPVVQKPRSSATIVEYPVVADVDNDGSAEILVGSSHPYVYSGFQNPYPTLQVFQDKDDRWIQARRIWNQHTYHVSNVREDGTIPQYEPKHWLELNTFRTNAQIEHNGICDPVG